MCSDCDEESEPICDYCGDSCYGNCDDPDTCSSCWYSDCIEGIDQELLDGCIEEKCACNCHEDIWGVWGDLGYFKAGINPRFTREGVFPFLKLPGEIREKVYGFSFLQDGMQRKSASHRGSIHTALLGTCHQINNEARHLPLTINKLCFDSALSAHDFLGFLLAPTQRNLVTGMHIEFHIREFHHSSWRVLLRELAKMPISHLGLTIKGGVPKAQLSGHTCFTNRFKVLKNLKTFDLSLASAWIKDNDKKEIEEDMRKALIKDYTRSKALKKKRPAPADVVVASSKASKKSKKANASIKHQTKIVASPKSNRLGIKSQKPERDAAKAAREQAKQILLNRYNQLEQYATSLDSDAAPVKIRLERARAAVEAVEEIKFERLAHGILSTLEERYDKIATARKNLPVFRTPSTSPETMSSPELTSSLDNEDLSQLSI